MPTVAHFIDVGEGNMTLLRLADGTIMLYDCNVTNDNEVRVLRYLARVLPRKQIDIFVNSHRDADHIRGVDRVHRTFPIKKVWDSGVAGSTTDSPEYLAYMRLRRKLPYVVVEARKKWDFGRTRIRVMNSKNDDLPDDPNAQSIVMKVQQHHTRTGDLLDSLMLAGDTDAQTWKDSIMTFYDESDVRSSILLGSHHGAITFFDDPRDEDYYYTHHMKSIKPAMTLLSVGPNNHGHPDWNALELYEDYSTGSNRGNKVFRTDEQGTMRLVLKDEGGWLLQVGR